MVVKWFKVVLFWIVFHCLPEAESLGQCAAGSQSFFFCVLSSPGIEKVCRQICINFKFSWPWKQNHQAQNGHNNIVFIVNLLLIFSTHFITIWLHFYEADILLSLYIKPIDIPRNGNKNTIKMRLRFIFASKTNKSQTTTLQTQTAMNEKWFPIPLVATVLTNEEKNATLKKNLSSGNRSIPLPWKCNEARKKWNEKKFFVNNSQTVFCSAIRRSKTRHRGEQQQQLHVLLCFSAATAFMKARV